MTRRLRVLVTLLYYRHNSVLSVLYSATSHEFRMFSAVETRTGLETEKQYLL